MCGWVNGSICGSGQISNNLINLNIIEIIQFCLKIYDLKEKWVGVWIVVWMGGSVGQWVGSSQVTNN